MLRSRIMPMTDDFARLGQNLRVAANVDQAESAAIKKGASSVNGSLFDERVSGVFDDESEGDRITGVATPEEELAGATLEQIEERQELLGAAYPFSVKGQVLEYTGQGQGVYEFCLALSLMDHTNNQNSNEIVLFELISAGLIAEMLGGSWIRTGWPSHNPDERPPRLAAMAGVLAGRCGEWKWSPGLLESMDPDPTEAKDEGLDFVVWRNLDARLGSLFVAGQCACGNNWRTKLTDLTSDNLRRWWTEQSLVPFTRAFTTPYVIPGRNAITTISRRAGLTFDRIRLTLAGHDSGKDWGQWLKEQRERYQLAAA